MVAIDPVKSSQGMSQTANKLRENQNRKEKQEQVAAGVGGAAGLSQTTKLASKRGLSAEAGEKALQKMMQTTQRTTQSVNKTTGTLSKLFKNFNAKVKFYTKDIMTRFPLLKHCAGFLGGALAFFVLVTGVNKAVKTGAIAVDDFKHQINDFKSIA